MRILFKIHYFIILLLLLNNLNNLVKSDTEPKRCRKNGCKNFIANACYLSSHSCESCVCACLLLCSTKTKVASINAEGAVVDPSESGLIQEESPLPHDGDHLINGIM